MERLSQERYHGTNRIRIFFSRSFTASIIEILMSLLGSVLDLIEKLRPFARRSVSNWHNCLEDILITYFFICYVVSAICSFLLAHWSNKVTCQSLFFVKSKHSIIAIFKRIKFQNTIEKQYTTLARNRRTLLIRTAV